MVRSRRFALISFLAGLGGCFLGGQSGDPSGNPSGPACVTREAAWDEVLPIERVSARQLVERRGLVTSVAYWFEASTEPPGGFEPEQALRVGSVSVALEPDLRQLPLICGADVELPVEVTISLDDGSVQEFAAVLMEALASEALYLAERDTAELLSPDREPWPGLGACSPYYSYADELSRGQLCLDDVLVRWPTACGGWTQTPLGVSGASGVGSVAPLLAEAGTRELRAAGLPALSLTLSSTDPTQCDLFASYSFSADLVAQTSGISETRSATFNAAPVEDRGGPIRVTSEEFCFSVSASDEWAAIVRREGAGNVLCVTPSYTLDASQQIHLVAEVFLMGSTKGWVYE